MDFEQVKKMLDKSEIVSYFSDFGLLTQKCYQLFADFELLVDWLFLDGCF